MKLLRVTHQDLCDELVASLVAQHMLGEPVPQVGDRDVVRASKERDHRGRQWWLHRTYRRRLLLDMLNLGLVARIGDGLYDLPGLA